MPLIYNCAPYNLVIDPNALAIEPGGSIEVTEDEAVSLCEGPDWSLTPPAAKSARASKSPEPSESTPPASEATEPDPGESKE